MHAVFQSIISYLTPSQIFLQTVTDLNRIIIDYYNFQILNIYSHDNKLLSMGTDRLKNHLFR